MKAKLTVVLALVVLFGVALPGVAAARGPSPAQLQRAGWTCINAMPQQWAHCFPPGAFRSDATLSVLVFDTQDLMATDADLLGTELLLRADLYAGQPCTQDGGGEYELLPSFASGLPADYRICHHFDTQN
jgi:hypothetical protein